ncbi:hypothetical protein HYDPIDRAFT_90493 [Hydnomerulius pinastri MD-312]|uniref:CSC1/OSCA1-like 7TM region domain-containing protein n=1 Tax=Hydnomerulius pinastri MD-312 TaxID=994086 RepID=A0A0C9W9N6_9AGAM|nr:hypothetical protein HYDPIDRAFT_90493 [Hydnomerulius pinastri MD-312]
MGDIQTRPFSKDYSGLINQSVIAIGLAAICITSHEVMKRRRRGPHPPEGLGSVESWQFGYLYQGRSWARNPSPPTPKGWPLSWINDSLKVPQERLHELRGIDAALYVRFLRGCLFFVLLHTFTTAPILLPIHIHFSAGTVSSKSMTRASIASLVLTPEGLELLWIHICLLFWLTFTWIANLFYLCNGAFKLRAAKIQAAERHVESDAAAERDAQYHPHPHPQFPFQDIPSLDSDHSNRGLRLRTIMVSNVPVQLRSERELKEYFEYYMSRPLDKPSVPGLASTQPGLMNKFLAFGFNRAKRIPQHLPIPQSISITPRAETDQSLDRGNGTPSEEPATVNAEDIPVIDRVVIARKMTELASLLERREDILRSLEVAHIKLAKKTLFAVSREMDRRREMGAAYPTNGAPNGGGKKPDDVESGIPPSNNASTMDLLIRTLAPFVTEFDVANQTTSSTRKVVNKSKHALWHRRIPSPRESGHDLAALTKPSLSEARTSPSPDSHTMQSKTIWDALLSLPRTALDPYQPLIHLSVLFRGKTVPSIDYYTAKLNLLTSLITQNRARAVRDYDPVSTAFVTFKDPKDASRACKYLAVHPDNPLACLVTMAPQYEDIDWTRVMKSTFRAEIIKDWVINIGVWGFTIFWLFPVSLFVGLVSIQSIASFWPSLYDYLSRHPWQEEIIQSFIPTLLVSLLTILIPLILLLIAKKAHTITTLSLLHDTIMTRYYKFLIVNVLVFFCVGTAALQTFLSSFKTVSGSSILEVVANSFPTAGPFYVGWLIFTTAIHGFVELVMFGLPLFMYPSTKRQITPRKRAVGIRPRTFNFYYWLPNHLLVIHVCLLFALLNPLILPFGLVYFAIETAVVKNQLLHVYAKNYECNGRILLIRMVRYSLDGLMLSQFVFLAYMAVLKKTVNLALAAVLFILTAGVKVVMTRMCRSRFEQDDLLEAEVVCRTGNTGQGDVSGGDGSAEAESYPDPDEGQEGAGSRLSSRFLTWRIPEWVNFSYNTNPRRVRHPQRRQPNPFRTRQESFSRLNSVDERRKEEPLPDESHPKSILGGAIHFPPVEEHPSAPPPRSVATSLVSKHPPHPAWDDDPRYDIPYDNPYYTRPITNVLWLPRDPFGLLNLDDTLDVRHSLTSEPGAGDLGYWSGPSVSTMAPLYESPSRSPEEERGSIMPGMTKQYSGTEDIDLPEGIRSRVMANESDDEIERSKDRPSLFRRRISSSGTSTKSSMLRLSRGPTGRSQRSQTLDGRPGMQHMSSSEQNVGAVRPRTTSLLLPPEPSRPRVRAVDPAMRPDFHAQADLMRSVGSFFPRGGASGISLARNVTTGEAVFNEAIAEEQIAAEERLKKEEAEAGRSRRLPSPAWLTSWIYAKVHHPSSQS